MSKNIFLLINTREIHGIESSKGVKMSEIYSVHESEEEAKKHLEEFPEPRPGLKIHIYEVGKKYVGFSR